jgi:Lon protease-like protein
VETLVPLFPLGTVALPGTTVPLHVFEERYRAMVGDLLEMTDPRERLFGIVAIREGYEVGPHEARSMYRVGCLMRLTEVSQHPDGRYDVTAVGQSRLRVVATDTSRPYLRGQVEVLEDQHGGSLGELAEAAAAALTAYEAYRSAVAHLGAEPEGPRLPHDVVALSYALGTGALLPLSERQRLLESPTARDRLELVRRQLRSELQAMQAVPSLPATEIARSGWSPN